MYKVMEALVEVNFDGIVIPDHLPGLGRRPEEARLVRGAAPGQSLGLDPAVAYSIGYLNATLKAAQSNKRSA
jgi:hypothetical protein